VEIYIFTRFHATPGNETAVEEALREVVPLAREEAGCLYIHAFRSIRDPQVFFIHSRWKDLAAFETHAGLPHTVRFVERVGPLIDQKIEANRCELIA
jgi:quinol monooxygenase YgiN